MQSFKFSLLFYFFFSFYAFGEGQSGDSLCLHQNFDVNVSHKGSPFGLSENILKVSKLNCTIKIEHQKFFYLKKKWEIDVCRGPIHIKNTNGAIEVYKKTLNCTKTQGKENEFCIALNNIFEVLQDDGLIFAEGEKENLETHHGKIFCSYALLQSYLVDDIIFNRNASEVPFFLKLPWNNAKETISVKSPQIEKEKPLANEKIIEKEEISEPQKFEGTF